jgi:hypothetical protein
VVRYLRIIMGAMKFMAVRIRGGRYLLLKQREMNSYRTLETKAHHILSYTYFEIADVNYLRMISRLCSHCLIPINL